MLIENCDTPGDSHFLPCAPNFKPSKNCSPWKNIGALRLFLQGLFPSCLLQTCHRSHKHAGTQVAQSCKLLPHSSSFWLHGCAASFPYPPKRGEKTRTCPSPATASLMHLPLGSQTLLGRRPCKNLGLPQSWLGAQNILIPCWSRSILCTWHKVSRRSASAFNWMTDYRWVTSESDHTHGFLHCLGQV